MTRSSSEEASEAGGGGGGAAVTSLLPLRITCSPSQEPRTPTLKECKLIIRQLYHANTTQYQEVSSASSCLSWFIHSYVTLIMFHHSAAADQDGPQRNHLQKQIGRWSFLSRKSLALWQQQVLRYSASISRKRSRNILVTPKSKERNKKLYFASH